MLGWPRAGAWAQGWLDTEALSSAPACRGAGAAVHAGARAAAHGQGRVRISWSLSPASPSSLAQSVGPAWAQPVGLHTEAAGPWRGRPFPADSDGREARGRVSALLTLLCAGGRSSCWTRPRPMWTSRPTPSSRRRRAPARPCAQPVPPLAASSLQVHWSQQRSCTLARGERERDRGPLCDRGAGNLQSYPRVGCRSERI